MKPISITDHPGTAKRVAEKTSGRHSEPRRLLAGLKNLLLFSTLGVTSRSFASLRMTASRFFQQPVKPCPDEVR
jgi:hypothetical protein